MKKIITITLLLVSLISAKAETLELNLVSFAQYASQANGVNILIDEELKQENIVFIINDKKDYLLTAFRKAVQLRGLVLEYTKEFYYVRKKDVYKEHQKYRSIKLNFVRYEDIKNLLSVYDNIKYEFIKTSKILLVRSNTKEFRSIYEMIKTIDVLPNQLKLKITIVDTNIDKIVELGSDTSNLNINTSDLNFFMNLVSYPFNINSTVQTKQSKGFYTFLKFLSKNGQTDLLSNPTLTLSDEKTTIFNVVENIPYNVGTTVVDDNDTKTTNSYEYKDVGLQIKVTPHIYSKDNVYIDLELNVSNIISNSSDKPITSKKYIKQSFHLPINQLLVLTGINKKEHIKSNSEIPVLSKIPYLGWLFKYESNQTNSNNLSIVFELYNDKTHKIN